MPEPIARMLLPERYKGIKIQFEKTYDYTPNLSWYVMATWRDGEYGSPKRTEGKTKEKAFAKAKREIDKQDSLGHIIFSQDVDLRTMYKKR